MSIMGLLFGLALAFASKIFHVDRDPKIEQVLSHLPGGNCGACGKAGCAGFARAVASGDLSLNKCPVTEASEKKKISEILGIESGSEIKKIARVKCGGGVNAKDKYAYEGVKTCEVASLFSGGQKLCSYGCLGFGDCVASCPFDAIHPGPNGVPVVDDKKCTACGRCVKACPKDLISLEDERELYYVKCSSRDNAAAVRKACKKGCIGCKICEKLSKGAFTVKDNLSTLDYSKVEESTPLGLCVEKCPTKCIEERRQK